MLLHSEESATEQFSSLCVCELIMTWTSACWLDWSWAADSKQHNETAQEFSLHFLMHFSLGVILLSILLGWSFRLCRTARARLGATSRSAARLFIPLPTVTSGSALASWPAPALTVWAAAWMTPWPSSMAPWSRSWPRSRMRPPKNYIHKNKNE